MDFDTIIDRRGTHCAKWDMMETLYGVAPQDGLAMWVADMDFRPPACVQRAVQGMADHGIYGYFGDDRAYRAAICWWMANRHGWEIEPEWIHTTHGIVNAVALAIDCWTEPGDGVVTMTPVYHAFHRVIAASGRRAVQLQMRIADGLYLPDFDAWEGQVPPEARLFLLCSPHNPGGRVWTAAELGAIADFCERHDLILVSDEIHHDLVLPGHRHLPTAVAAPQIAHRLVTMTAPSKSFNIAGVHTGNVIIGDARLRDTFARRLGALGLSPNSFGVVMATAAYSPEGAAWLDRLVDYLDGNRRLFDDGVNAIPGLHSMPLQATYLAWVDTSGTGMSAEEVGGRIAGQARIAANAGGTFGAGGAGYVRFNIATPRARVAEAVRRLQAAFADLQ